MGYLSDAVWDFWDGLNFDGSLDPQVKFYKGPVSVSSRLMRKYSILLHGGRVGWEIQADEDGKDTAIKTMPSGGGGGTHYVSIVRVIDRLRGIDPHFFKAPGWKYRF